MLATARESAAVDLPALEAALEDQIKNVVDPLKAQVSALEEAMLLIKGEFESAESDFDAACFRIT